MEKIKFYDSKRLPFKLLGCFNQTQYFRRIDQKIVESISENLVRISKMCSGLRLQFITDSDTIVLKIKQKYNIMPHMPLTGVSGFDLYKRKNNHQTFIKTIIPPLEYTDGFVSEINNLDKKETEYILYFPLYNEVFDIEIGLKKGALLKEGTSFKYTDRVLFYGSSITQGGCASRAGNSYPALLSQEFDFDFVNLGFSGSCFGEQQISEAIGKENFGAIVIDYDHNAKSIIELKATHFQFCETIRKLDKRVPIILVSKPIFYETLEDKKRRDLIKDTYNAFFNKHDENIYFLDGHTFFTKFERNAASVDGVHPNDLGFYLMKNAFSKIFLKIFK